MAKDPREWDNSHDETEFFDRPQGGRGYDYGSGSDETEVFDRQSDSYGRGQDRQETEFFDRPSQQPTPDRPQQQFPEGYDPVSGTYAPGYGPDANRGYHNQGYSETQYQQQYQGVPPHHQGQQYQPQQPPQQRPRQKKKGSGGLVALGFLTGLALVAAIVFFLMWRGSESKPDPVPVTETATVTQTQTVEQTPERDPIVPTELPELPSDVIPTALPELPSEVRDFDIEGFVNDLLGNQPAQPAQ